MRTASAGARIVRRPIEGRLGAGLLARTKQSCVPSPCEQLQRMICRAAERESHDAKSMGQPTRKGTGPRFRDEPVQTGDEET